MAVTRTKPHSLSIFLRNPHDLGNKTVNPLLTASVAQQGRLHITPDERRDAGRLYRSGRASRSRALCQPDSKLFYASGALIFHTVSSHDSPFPQRKIARDEKKRTPCDRLVHCAAEFRLQAGGGGGFACLNHWGKYWPAKPGLRSSSLYIRNTAVCGACLHLSKTFGTKFK